MNQTPTKRSRSLAKLLGVTLGLLPTAVWADDLEWRSASPKNGSAPLVKPISALPSRPTTSPMSPIAPMIAPTITPMTMPTPAPLAMPSRVSVPASRPNSPMLSQSISQTGTEWRSVTARGQSPDDFQGPSTPLPAPTPVNPGSTQPPPFRIPYLPDENKPNNGKNPADPNGLMSGPTPGNLPQMNAPQSMPTEHELPPGMMFAPGHGVQPAGHSIFGHHRAPRFGSPEITIARDYDLGLIQPLMGNDYRYQAAFRAEYLLWWTKADRAPVLASTSDPSIPFNDPNAPNGRLGQPTTTVIYGGEDLDNNVRNGGRFTFDWWRNDCMGDGFQAQYFFTSPYSDTKRFDSSQFPVLARPIFAPNINPNTGLPLGEFTELVSAPGLATGVLEIYNDSEFWGASIGYQKMLCSTCDTRRELYMGFRYLDLRETLRITETILAGPLAAQQDPPTVPGSLLVVTDEFKTLNRFYGGQIGGRYEQRFGRFFVDFRGSLALGVTEQNVNINGGIVSTTPGQPSRRFAGGLLTTPSNIGSHTEAAFSVVPEITTNIGYQWTDRFRTFAGFNFLYWTNVVRPGTEIDRVVDVTLVPIFAPDGTPSSGTNRPQVKFDQTDFWATGLNFGFEYRW
ncbi:BBP7 family outer membrane beta-barrel protein [Tuwongella immobilis]|uniref:Uncharacterized protein n=1 Tax=Tuwongella immobilis TaxID=692036 RepID=A0A6C2YME4_9BACT|nr:BBP7 family outer membrane beta-barrel protein [Tuwongella immobilis]VIP02527.1 Protein containing DUF1551 OS=Rhodopirellula maiorica SM1 GN=RMSM_05043 PE=4 SV=1: DUF1551 [Tuwongella immobilis]VTS01670.1 Protein containing DUF1551 OS=Rhodopirellula maiorica SM1 GN=RMSM_05043 PE=4 SV=1: DUF1551 [Tuwongella immobilis]